MKKIKIVGNRELKGRIEVSGAKNSVVESLNIWIAIYMNIIPARIFAST